MKQWILMVALAYFLTGCAGAGFAPGGEASRTVSLVIEPAAGPARHGADVLEKALRDQGWAVDRAPSLEAAKAGRVIVAGTVKGSGPVAGLIKSPNEALPAKPEALAVKLINRPGQSILLLCGADEIGLMYAELDAAERIGWAKGAPENGVDPFSQIRDIREEPRIVERSVTAYTFNRAYWESRFYDEKYWERYFDTLAADRFNAFVLIFGYENGGFMAPAYPYFFDMPEYPNVKFNGITPEQQQKNLAALNRLIAIAHERGIAIQLGIWDHVYRGGVQAGGIEWAGRYAGGPIPNTVTGIDAQNLVPYNQAALEHFLKVVPDFDRVSFRMHPESGLRTSEMESFWTDIFKLIKRVRPTMGVELRSKELPDRIIKIGQDTGLNLRIETKFWMEQMGLPFHPTHTNTQDQKNRRHGYADLLRFPQTYKVMWRHWNGGTSRILLWGAPDYVRRYSDAATLYDSNIWEVDEPLQLKMEAQPPDMPTFDLMPAQYRYYDYEFERYWHFFKVWGRLGYDPQTPAETIDHDFTARFGPAAGPDLEAALHRASWIPGYIVASVYPYSGFPATVGWVEKQPMGATLAQYARNQGTDIAQFENFQDAAERIMKGGTTAMRTPEASAAWLDKAADDVLATVDKAEKVIGDKRGKEFDSTVIDLKILADLARFHARRARAAVHYNLYRLSHDLREFDEAVAGEKNAIDAWRDLVAVAGDRYNYNLAFGAKNRNLTGHWRDELAILDKSFAALQQERAAANPAQGTVVSIPPKRSPGDAAPPKVEHQKVLMAKPNEPLKISARVTDPSGVESVRVRYRHLTQYEDYATLELKPGAEPGIYEATIPGGALSPDWDFIYYLEAIDNAGNGIIYPDLDREAPYVIVRLHGS